MVFRFLINVMDVLNRMPDCSQSEKIACNPSPLDSLRQQKMYLTERLQRVDEAIQALEENPEVTKVLELLSKVR